MPVFFYAKSHKLDPQIGVGAKDLAMSSAPDFYENPGLETGGMLSKAPAGAKLMSLARLRAGFSSGRAIFRYGLAVLLVTAATATSFLIELATDRVLSFPFYVAIVLSTWFGVGPGLFVIICSVFIIDYFWIPPIYTLGIDADNWAWYIVFTGTALISLIWTWQRRTSERALEATVAQRTADLMCANAALTKEIADRRAAEAELQEAQAEVARTLRLATVAETAAAIAHEINQPLAAISTNASACLRSLDRNPPVLGLAQEAASCIVEDANRAAEVVARVRGLLNKEGPRRAPVDLNRMVHDVSALSRGASQRQGIAIRAELSPSLPLVCGDPVQLQQVLLNLVTNGIESMTEVSARSRVLTIRSGLDESGVVVVTVEDTGTGIDPKHAERVFDSFYTTKPNGIGVGLSISRSIIEGHGGRLWLAAAGPDGARFCFTLPAAAAAA